jgi:hypothetical protein
MNSNSGGIVGDQEETWTNSNTEYSGGSEGDVGEQ